MVEKVNFQERLLDYFSTSGTCCQSKSSAVVCLFYRLIGRMILKFGLLSIPALFNYCLYLSIAFLKCFAPQALPLTDRAKLRPRDLLHRQGHALSAY